jgi:hypothetical protein
MSTTLAPEKPAEAPRVRRRRKHKNPGERPPQNKGGRILIVAFVGIIAVAILVAYFIISP